MTDKILGLRETCDSHDLQATPRESWGVEDLGRYARGQHSTIGQSEQELAANYWRLGLALNLVRPRIPHGNWSMFLDEHEIEHTRAAKARSINDTFPSAAALEGMSVQQAYNLRKRKQANRKKSKRRASGERADLTVWLRSVSEQADSYYDELEGCDADSVVAPFAAIDMALSELERLRDRLQSLLPPTE